MFPTVQWGIVNGTKGFSNADTVTFPVTFSTACYAVVKGCNDESGWSSEGVTGNVGSVTKTGFIGKSDYGKYYWMAIGK